MSLRRYKKPKMSYFCQSDAVLLVEQGGNKLPCLKSLLPYRTRVNSGLAREKPMPIGPWVWFVGHLILNF